MDSQIPYSDSLVFYLTAVAYGRRLLALGPLALGVAAVPDGVDVALPGADALARRRGGAPGQPGAPHRIWDMQVGIDQGQLESCLFLECLEYLHLLFWVVRTYEVQKRRDSMKRELFPFSHARFVFKLFFSYIQQI